MKSKRNVPASILIIALLLYQLIQPVTVFADGETTPPPDVPTEVLTTPEPVELTEVTSTPVPTEPIVDPVEITTALPSTDPTPIPAGLPELAEEETESVQASPPEEVANADELTVVEILQQVPEGTDVVVLNENGGLEPLATQDAAETIITGDPMWCPEGVLPGGSGCTPGTTSVYDLISKLTTGYSGSGTIYFTSTYTIDDVTFDHSSLVHLDDLVIQGGWNGLIGTGYAISGNTVFTVPVSITNWNGNVTVNDITVNNTSSNGLSISNLNGNVTVNNITIHNNVGYGLYINTTGDIAMNESNFSSNIYGLYASGDELTILQSTFTGNDIGVESFARRVTINDSNFINNYFDGVAVRGDDLTISRSTFSGNGRGLYASKSYGTSNVIVIENVFIGNDIGISTSSGYGNINLTLNCNQFTDNIEDTRFSAGMYGIGSTTLIDIPCPPQNDRDRDGIVDDDDACPDVPGIRTDNPLTNGCPLPPPPPPQIITVDGNTITFPMDCSLFSSYIPVWPNGDQVLISCVPNGMAVVSRVENTDLSNGLDAGYEYASAFKVEVFQGGAPLPVMPEGGSIQVSFAAQEDDNHYGIMYWNAAINQWTLLEELQLTPGGKPMTYSLSGGQDPRNILAGTQFTTGDLNRQSVTTNFTGTYVLVVQK